MEGYIRLTWLLFFSVFFLSCYLIFFQPCACVLDQYPPIGPGQLSLNENGTMEAPQKPILLFGAVRAWVKLSSHAIDKIHEAIGAQFA